MTHPRALAICAATFAAAWSFGHLLVPWFGTAMLENGRMMQHNGQAIVDSTHMPVWVYYSMHNSVVDLLTALSGVFSGVGSLVYLAGNAFYLGSVSAFTDSAKIWHTVPEFAATILSASVGLLTGWNAIVLGQPVRRAWVVAWMILALTLTIAAGLLESRYWNGIIC